MIKNQIEFPEDAMEDQDLYLEVIKALRDKLYELNIKFNNRNSLKIASLFQDVFIHFLGYSRTLTV